MYKSAWRSQRLSGSLQADRQVERGVHFLNRRHTSGSIVQTQRCAMAATMWPARTRTAIHEAMLSLCQQQRAWGSVLLMSPDTFTVSLALERCVRRWLRRDPARSHPRNAFSAKHLIGKTCSIIVSSQALPTWLWSRPCRLCSPVS